MTSYNKISVTERFRKARRKERSKEGGRKEGRREGKKEQRKKAGGEEGRKNLRKREEGRKEGTVKRDGVNLTREDDTRVKKQKTKLRMKHTDTEQCLDVKLERRRSFPLTVNIGFF